MEHKHDDRSHDGHGHSRLMIGMMVGCLVIGLVGVFYTSFYLDLAFVVTMGVCVGHHLVHRFRKGRHSDEPG